MTQIDIRAIRMIKLSEDGSQLPDDATGHVAVLLPDFGLIFDARTPEQADNWNQAKELASKVDLLGHDDWVLPEAAELALLIDRSRYNPAINTDFFPNTPLDDWYWTATVDASDSSSAWSVHFYYGYVYYCPQYHSGFVRACRRVSPGQ